MIINLKTNKQLTNLQDTIYANLNKLSSSHRGIGRLCSVPISVIDIGLETCKTPLNIIENVAYAALNLIGFAFSKKYELKHALLYAESACSKIINIPVVLGFAPIKVFFQTFMILINPQEVNSINYCRPTFGYYWP